MQLRENVPLSDLTTFHIGGPARYVATVTSVEELKEALDFAQEKQLAIKILGGGSNVLASDDGFDGLVIHIALQGITFDGPTVVVAAGEEWDALVAQSVVRDLWGLENLSGIPGSVGGAIVGGIGAYGASVGEHMSGVEAFNINTRQVEQFSNAQCTFGYRDSVFKHRPELVVLRATFELSAESAPNVSYKDLAARFANSSLDLPTIRAAVLTVREGKFPDIAVEGTAGSYFKNPMVDEAAAEALREQYPELPLFAMPEVSGYKVPLAWLLDRVLGLKGTSVGGARLFERQPLVIAAGKGCSATDVHTLASMVKKDCKEKLFLDIEEEVVTW
jgi:UDP-N-acetylmuramate dehydrogenase